MFCFAPETMIRVLGRGLVPISSVRCGEILEDSGDKVTSTYRFMADGQSMVRIGSVEVSTNHFVLVNGYWQEAKNHPDAVHIGDWSGGQSRPLICLDTESHRIPIDGMIFSDWDETSLSDIYTMKLAEEILNGYTSSRSDSSSSFDSESDVTYSWPYQPAIDPTTMLKMKNGGYKKAMDIQEGDELSTGKVIGAGWRHVNSIVKTHKGTCVTPSTLLWTGNEWERTGCLGLKIIHNNTIMRTLCVKGTSSIETYSGERLRDMLEVWSPHMEGPTREKLNPSLV